MSCEIWSGAAPLRRGELVTRRVRAVGTREELPAQLEHREVFARRPSVAPGRRGGARLRCEVWFGVKALRDKQFVAGRVRVVGIHDEFECREVFG
jgi:hypothetical protein